MKVKWRQRRCVEFAYFACLRWRDHLVPPGMRYFCSAECVMWLGKEVPGRGSGESEKRSGKVCSCGMRP